MSKKEQHSFSNILSVNPYNNTYVSAVASFLNETSSPQFNKQQYVISHLDTKGFINSHISVSKNIPQEDLYDAIYNKAYDELGLDQAITYQIQYIEVFNNLDEDHRNFHVFIIDPLVVNDVFKTTVEKLKYVDYIIPSPLLLKSLYTKEIIEDRGVHCFIYFQENDTFLAIYNDQDFLYTKSINYSLRQMHERFCEIYGELVEYENFISFISNEDLKTTQSPYKLHIIKLYKEIFSNINDILTYVKRALEIEKIHHIYIDSQIASVTHIDEMAEFELGIKSSNFNFNYGFESANAHMEHLHCLMQIFATTPESNRYDCNFSTFHRPPKFTQRDSGKAILLVAATFALAFLYPVSYWSLTYAQTLQHKLLEREYHDVHGAKLTREAIINNKTNEKEKVAALVEKEKQDYIEKKNTLIKIHDVKVNYPMKANLLHMFSKDLNKFEVRVEHAIYSEKEGTTKTSSSIKELKLGLVSTNDKKITGLIEYLTKIYEGKFHFSIEEISYKDESKLYFGELKVSLL